MVTHDNIEEVLRAKLLALRVQAYPRLYQLIDFKVHEIKLNRWILVPGAGEARKEDLNMSNELVNERLIERVRKESILSPQFDYFYMFDARQVIPMIRQLCAFVLRERLRHFLSVLREPISLTIFTL